MIDLEVLTLIFHFRVLSRRWVATAAVWEPIQLRIFVQERKLTLQQPITI